MWWNQKIDKLVMLISYHIWNLLLKVNCSFKRLLRFVQHLILVHSLYGSLFRLEGCDFNIIRLFSSKTAEKWSNGDCASSTTRSWSDRPRWPAVDRQVLPLMPPASTGALYTETACFSISFWLVSACRRTVSKRAHHNVEKKTTKTRVSCMICWGLLPHVSSPLLFNTYLFILLRCAFYARQVRRIWTVILTVKISKLKTLLRVARVVVSLPLRYGSETFELVFVSVEHVAAELNFCCCVAHDVILLLCVVYWLSV